MEEQQSQTFFQGPLWERLMQLFQERGRVWYRSCGSKLLLTQLDILGRMANTFFQHKADRYAEEGIMCNVLGIFP